MCKATHYNLLHGHPSGGGLGFGHIWDDTNKEKLTLLQELLYTEVPTAKAAGLNFLFRLQTASKLNEAPLTTTLGSTVVCPTGWVVGLIPLAMDVGQQHNHGNPQLLLSTIC